MPGTSNRTSKSRAAKPGGKPPKGQYVRSGRKGLSPAPAKPSPEQTTPLGRQLIEGLESLLTVMESEGLAGVEKRFTVRRVRKATFEKPALGKADVVAIRTALGASQVVFASLLGVSAATVRAWEQGVNAPSGIAIRFLTEIRANPDYWKARLNEAIGI